MAPLSGATATLHDFDFPITKRKASISNLQAAVPKPLKIFKRASRTFSAQRVLSDCPKFSLEEPQFPGSRNSSAPSINIPVCNADPYVGGNSSLTILPNCLPANDNETLPQDGQGAALPDLPEDKPLLRKSVSRPSLRSVKAHIQRKASNINAPTTKNEAHCALCKSILESSLKTYAFPRTAPAILATISRLYPEMDRSVTSSTLLGTPTPIRAAIVSPAFSHDGSEGPITSRRKSSFPSTSPMAVDTSSGKTKSLGFCLTCFEHFHFLHICWSCGERIERSEERVGCGWAWWHWGCVGCLLCRVSDGSLSVLARRRFLLTPVKYSIPSATRSDLSLILMIGASGPASLGGSSNHSFRAPCLSWLPS